MVSRGRRGGGTREKKIYQIGPFNYYLGGNSWHVMEPALLACLGLCLQYIAPSDARLEVSRDLRLRRLLYRLLAHPIQDTPGASFRSSGRFYLILGSRDARCRPRNPSEAARILASSVCCLQSALRPASSAASRLNFFRFTNEKEPYVYVQTFPEIEEALTEHASLKWQGRDPRYYHVHGQIVLDL